MLILGIETSCDDTCVAIIDDHRKILSNCRYSQIKEHQRFGGVVPEIAARNHLELLPGIFKQALLDANIASNNIDIVAATAGPGLIGGLITGFIFAKTISSCLGKTFYGINHLEGHILTPRLTHAIRFPYLALLASGGHLQIVWVRNIADYQILSSTVDDSAGESFDKVAKMLGLSYPGGPNIEKLAKLGDERRFKMPMPMCTKDELNFSFSGLKTFVRGLISKSDLALDSNDICASFQKTVCDIFEYKILQAISLIKNEKVERFALVGGVAANSYIRYRLKYVLQSNGILCTLPDIQLCTDNAAMIAWVACDRYVNGVRHDNNSQPVPRWPLHEVM
ncbi:tRNA N6-adenosine threonylcarbamoyltransferase [Candidatus Cyrtobacter comes]|uniref:tRNA N6-adenosine threonylcarbamoyltransferase n=1 Tax=Candidatus Cyrtobacter comes TaxID=675776 RepID=A0ABU5L736_9RICK|nr:tRNA N6-adenosine threonylcarbamoyltransferase [Candidatus Cyrtobacter comes]